jgi:hypothetical protein
MNQYISLALDKYDAIVENFQLLDIEFPATFSGAISETQVRLRRQKH